MTILEAEKNKEYEIKFLCDDLRLSEIGLIPGDTIILKKIQGGLVWFELGIGGSFTIREIEAKCIRVG